MPPPALPVADPMFPTFLPMPQPLIILLHFMFYETMSLLLLNLQIYIRLAKPPGGRGANAQLLPPSGCATDNANWILITR